MALPLVLAGPILRRVEPRAVSVWIALREQADVSLSVWSGQQVSTGPLAVESGAAPAASTSSAVTTRAIAPRLHVVVVTATATAPAPALAPGTLHSYDLRIQAGGVNQGLRGLSFLVDQPAGSPIEGAHASAPGRLALGYGPNRLPGFVTPPASLDGLRIAQASCRKASGHGHDAMAWLDDLVDPTAAGTASTRPHQLFLTGDQIYADDVASSMLPMLNRLGAALMGGDIDAEDLLTGPRYEGLEVEAGRRVQASHRHFPALRRQRLVRDRAKFTSDAGDNHLLSFAEFAAMYLCAWSPTVWRGLADATQVFVDDLESEVESMLTDWEGCHGSSRTWGDKATAAFEAQRDDVVAYRRLVPKVARALANVPTYMIFDDHEVTDDWYLNRTWRTRVLGAPLGRDVLRNGLAAFAVFQGWGNDPATWEVAGGRKRELLEKIAEAHPAAGDLPAPAARGRIEELLGMAGTASEIAWHFTIDGPRHRVVVLDTRTRRSFATPAGPPQLLGSSLDAQLPAGPFTDGRELLLVVAAAPVIGTELIDRMIAPLAAATVDAVRGFSALGRRREDPCEAEPVTTGGEMFDAEGWAADEQGTEALLNRIASYGKAVILSGDVHYAGAFVVDHWRRGTATPSRILQCTSSAARNPWPQIVQAILRSNLVSHRLLALGFPAERLAWSSGPAGLQVPSGASVGAGRRARMRASPSLLPANGWPAGTTIAGDKPPDWRWRADMLVDPRPDSERPSAVAAPTLSATLDPGNPLAGLVAIAGRHQAAALARPPFEPLRRMVFVANIGVLTVSEPTAGAPVATHTLWSRSGPSSDSASANTVHRVPLTTPSDAAPPTPVG